MNDGQTIHLHLPRPKPRFDLACAVWILLTLGLGGRSRRPGHVSHRAPPDPAPEALQHGVEQWGDGNLAARVPVSGTTRSATWLAVQPRRAADRNLVKARDALLASQKSPVGQCLPRVALTLGAHSHGTGVSFLHRSPMMRPSAPGTKLQPILPNSTCSSTRFCWPAALDAQQADLGTVEAVDLVGLCAEECSG